MMTAEDARTFDTYSRTNATIAQNARPCTCEAYQDIFTYNRWKAQGYQVKKGEKAIKITTYVPITKTRDDGEKEIIGRRPRTSSVFCRCQVKEDPQ